MDYAITDAVIRLQNGDEDAFNEIYERTRQSFYYIILKLVGNTSDAEDVLQETYLQIYRNSSKLNAPEAFIGWATKIACNAAYANGRKKKDILLGEDDRDLELLEELNRDFLPEDVIENEAKCQIILQIIDQLPLPQRTAIMLYYYQELKIPQIAEIMECSEGTVKSRLNYARNSIRKAVTDEETRSGKLYAIPLFLFDLDYKKLALSQGQFSEIFQRIAAQTSAVAPAGGGHSVASRFLEKKALHFTAMQKITGGILAAVLVLGIPISVYLSHKPTTNEEPIASLMPSTLGVTTSGDTAAEGVDLEIKGAYLHLTIHQPEDTSGVSGYSLDLLDSAHPENNINRQCDLDGDAYMDFKQVGTYDRVSITTLLDTGEVGGTWQNDVDIICTVGTMPAYTAQYSTEEGLIIAELSKSGPRYVQFDIASGTTTLDDKGYMWTYQDSNLVFLGGDKIAYLVPQLETGTLSLRLRSWNYSEPTCDGDKVWHMTTEFCDFGPYVSIPVGTRSIEVKE